MVACDSEKASLSERLPGIQKQTMSVCHLIDFFLKKKVLLRILVHFNEQTFFQKKKKKKKKKTDFILSAEENWGHGMTAQPPLGYYKLSKFLPPPLQSLSTQYTS